MTEEEVDGVPEGWLSEAMEGAASIREGMREMFLESAAQKEAIRTRTLLTLEAIKELLHELVHDLNQALKGEDERLRLEYRDRGKYEAEMRLGEDLLLVTMPPHVCRIPFENACWELGTYVSGIQPETGNCGVINFYNFLSDSFRYNRSDDQGYLVGRLFVSRDGAFFTEGKRLGAYSVLRYGEETLSRDALADILLTVLDFILDFDLLVPPYEVVKTVTVGSMNMKGQSALPRTGKRLGYLFNTQDVRNDDEFWDDKNAFLKKIGKF